MAVSGIRVTYDGGDALHHLIDAKLFGQSLQGLDRLVSDCLIIFSQQRLPKRGERAPILLKAKEPEAGSVTVAQVVQEASGLLAFGVPILSAIGPEIVNHYVKAVLDWFKGDRDAVELAIEQMAEMHKEALNALAAANNRALETVDEINKQRHDEAMGLQDLLRLAIRSSGSAAVDYVAPVGRERSVDTASFVSGEAAPVDIDATGADAIRESQKLDWKAPQEEIFVTDGFKFHTSGLSIENPDADGYLMAEVNDPVFEEESNPYTGAAQKRAKVMVLARRGYKNGKLARVIVLDFIREVES